MKKIVFAVMFGLLLTGCYGGEQKDLAAEAARTFYDSLLSGGYEHFVDGFDRRDSIPLSYRSQLVTNAKQYVYGLKEKHGAVEAVRIVRSKRDSVAGTTNVFLMLCFSDSLKEEIVVRMTEKEGVFSPWKGHRPKRLLPLRVNATYCPTTFSMGFR